jgi:light-regulated signal transduction histidine kinase (bacteriophytochrome)
LQNQIQEIKVNARFFFTLTILTISKHCFICNLLYRNNEKFLQELQELMKSTKQLKKQQFETRQNLQEPCKNLNNFARMRHSLFHSGQKPQCLAHHRKDIKTSCSDTVKQTTPA